MADFAASAIRPIARDCDEESEIPSDFLDTVWELGLTSTQIPEEFGGGGESRSPITNVILLEELAHGDATLALAALAPSLFANAIVDFGTPDQQRQYLPAFCEDKYCAASLALVEPGPCFDPQNLRTVAEPKGDGFTLSGIKSLVPMANISTHFLVVARNGGELDAFIVPREAEGLTISEKEKNLGLRAFPTATLELERVELGPEARLGGTRGCEVQRIIDASRTAAAAAMLGLSRAVLEYVVPYAKDREAFDEAIAKKQAIAFMCAEMHIEVEAMRWMVWKAASELEQGLDATRSAHLAREYAAEKSMWISDNGIQVLGGHGYIREHPVEMWFRNARTLGVLEGMVSV
jgi:alkylation response protein AidB-like acyl-CoA dehydrogenase